MPSISSAGIGSGLDVASIVTSLMAIEKQPLTRLQSDASQMQTRLSSFAQIQSLVSGLHDAAAPLFAAGSYTLTTATSSDASSVSAGTAGSAAPGTYSVAVSALSASQTTVSVAGQFVDGNSVVGTGSLTISLGTWTVDAFGSNALTPKPGSAAVTIAIGAADNTLAKVRDKINAANAGVSASLVTDASGTRLSLQSTATGAENGFKLTVADDDGSNSNAAGLSRLDYDITGAKTAQTTLSQAARNASATINGVAVTSTSNSFAGVVDGVTFSVGKVTVNASGPNPVSVNVTRNTDVIKNQLKNFVTSYNTLNSFLTQQTKYDAGTKSAALLQGDSTAVGLQNQIHQMLTQRTSASSVYASFSSLGVQVQKDGSLSLDDAKATAALSGNLAEVAKALSSTGTGSAAGLARGISDWTGKLLAADGSLPGKSKAIQGSIARNQKQQDAFNVRLGLIEQRIRSQYTALDSTMSKANALAKYVTQQFSTNNNNNSN